MDEAAAILGRSTPPLDAASERELIARCQAGDQDARDRLVTSNLRLIALIASKAWGRRTLGRRPVGEDLIQTGIVGFLTALDRFDPSRGNRLGAYANWYVRQAVQVDEQLTPMIRPARGEQAIPVNRETDYGDGSPLSEMAIDPVDDEPTELAEGIERLHALIARLPDRLRHVARSHAEGATLREIGESLGVTKERARQLMTEASAQLRDMAPDDAPPPPKSRFTATRFPKRYFHAGREWTPAEWAEHIGITRNGMDRRIKRLGPERAFAESPRYQTA